MTMTVVQSVREPFAPSPTDVRRSDSADTWTMIRAHRLEDLGALRADWLALRERSGMAGPGNDPDRFALIVRHLQGDVRPDVVLWRDANDRPKAMIIGRRMTRRDGCRFGYWSIGGPKLRCLDVVYGGVISDGTPEADQAIAAELVDRIDHCKIDMVMINHPKVDDDIARGALEVGGIPVRRHIAPPASHWRYEFAEGGFEASMARFSRKHRYNIRRADRLLTEHCEGALALRSVTDVSQLDWFIEHATAITSVSYQGALGAGFGDVAIQRPLLEHAAARGEARCFVLMHGDTAIAFQSGMVVNGTYHLHATAFRPEYAAFSPGQVLLVRALAEVRAGGADRVDYGFGDARYKQIYGTLRWNEATVRLYAPTARARLAHGLWWASNAGRSAVERVAARFGSVSAIKKRWRAALSRSASGGESGR